MYNTFILENKEHVTILTLNRPPVNTVNLEMREELDKALTEIENDKSSRVLVITGSGEKAFCAGMDVKDIANLRKGPWASDLWTRIDRFAKPVIAAINGTALGGGCELALACHIRIMADGPKASIGLTELDLGIIPGWGGTQRMTRILGRSKAMDMIMFSRKMTPAQALEIGLIDRVSPSGESLKAAMALAGEIAARPPIAVQSVLKCIITGLDQGIDKGLEMERECSHTVAASEDAREGLMAFMEKRKPQFKGK